MRGLRLILDHRVVLRSTSLVGAILILILMGVSVTSASSVYLWNNSSPTSPGCYDSIVVGDLHCPPVMNCSAVTFYPGERFHHETGHLVGGQPGSFGVEDNVVCSRLTVGVQRLVNGVPMPIQGRNVSIYGTLICEVVYGGENLGEIFLDVQMSGMTSTNGTVSFLMPNGLAQGNETCQTYDSSGPLLVETSRFVSTIQWPFQNVATIWLPSVSRPVFTCGIRCFID